MKHLNDCFHHWHRVSGWCKDFLLLCSNGKLLHYPKQFYQQIFYKFVYKDPVYGYLAIGWGYVTMPLTQLWGKVKVPCLFKYFLDDQFRSASFDLQLQKFWFSFTRHTFMAYTEWEWKIDYLFIKSTPHSLHSLCQASTIHFHHEYLALYGSCQRLVQYVEHNKSTIQVTLITRFTMHININFIQLKWIIILPHKRFKTKR